MSDSFQDPAAVAALLESLRASQAWQQLVAEQPPAAPHPQTSVADLLQQLRAPPPSVSIPHPGADSLPTGPAPPEPAPAPRSCTFQQALPLLSHLGGDPAFVAAITRMRDDQNTLERLLFADREAIHRKYAGKVKVAQNTANMVGAGISKQEANTLQEVYQKELRKFDKERVLPAWDALVSRQQAHLESLQVPNMFVTSDRKDSERQMQIIQILLGLVGTQ